MRMTFKVTYDDGKVVNAVAKPRDIVEFERRYKVSFMDFGRGAPMEWLYFLAWAPLHRNHKEPRDFDVFLEEVEEVETVADEEPPVPTPAGPSANSSPDSPSTSE